MSNLYDLTKRYIIAQEAICDPDQDISLAAWEELKIAESELSEKSAAYARMIRNIQAKATAYKMEADRLYAHQKACENAVARLNQLMHEAMTVFDIKQLETDIGKFSLQKNPPSCKVVSKDDIPEDYWIPQEPKLDGKGIIEHFKQTGENIPGTEVVQELGLRFR